MYSSCCFKSIKVSARGVNGSRVKYPKEVWDRFSPSKFSLFDFQAQEFLYIGVNSFLKGSLTPCLGSNCRRCWAVRRRLAFLHIPIRAILLGFLNSVSYHVCVRITTVTWGFVPCQRLHKHPVYLHQVYSQIVSLYCCLLFPSFVTHKSDASIWLTFQIGHEVQTFIRARFEICFI